VSISPFQNKKETIACTMKTITNHFAISIFELESEHKFSS